VPTGETWWRRGAFPNKRGTVKRGFVKKKNGTIRREWKVPRLEKIRSCDWTGGRSWRGTVAKNSSKETCLQ